MEKKSTYLLTINNNMTIWHFLTFSYITIFIHMHQILSNCVISSLSSLCNDDIYFSSPDDASCQFYISKKQTNMMLRLSIRLH